MKKFTQFFSVLCLAFFTLSVYAASPMGNWKTIDDKTGQAKSIVKISGSPGNLQARVVKLFPGALTVCSACPGNQQGKPIMGMTVMWGLRQNPNNPNEWTGGSIMDPKTGKIYRAMLTVSPDGRSMVVRGYIGVSLFGRSQTWYRQ